MRYQLNNRAKDPAVVHFAGHYFLYHSAWIPGEPELRIAIAVSDDLEHWQHVLYLPLDTDCEKKGNGAPAAIVLNGQVHLFYQTYGNGTDDAICHAVSDDGLHFEKDPTNPVYRPSKSWCCGRAIDADVAVFGDRLYLYIATRDSEFREQMLGAASADIASGFHRGDFVEEVEEAILAPALDWEGKCIEAPAAIVKDDRVWLFYGGSYNCTPQQIGLAVSDDGVYFRRVSDKPFFPNGAPGSWNASESGHPYVFEDDDGRIWLFFQGSPDHGRTLLLSRMELTFTGDGFSVAAIYDEPED